MRYLKTVLGGTPVTIYAPRPGTLDFGLLSSVFDMGGFYGLDVESTYMDEAGPWAGDYELKTAQFGTEDTAVVLRMDDPEQRDFAMWVLSPLHASEFTSHTQIDTVAVHAVLGADVAGRNLDTHWLSIMSAPDDRKGSADLKQQATLHGMPELARADKALDAVFDRMYREAHPEIGRRAIEAKKLARFGFNNVSLDDPVFFGYAGLDAIAVRRLAPKLTAMVHAPVHLLRNERWLSTEATRIRQRGHRVDVEALDTLQASTATEVAAVTEIITGITDLKPTQTVKLVAYFGEHGADWSDHPRAKGGSVSLAKGAGEKLLTYDLTDEAREVAKAYIRHAKVLDRLRKTEAIRAGLVTDADGLHRIHPTLLSIGTVSSRMSGANPNMQNFSKKDPAMRGLFLPEPYHVLLSCDFAQVEMRLMAALAGERKMIDVILSGGDLHTLTAELLGVGRQVAKTSNFLIGYGGSGKALRAQLNYQFELDYCNDVVARYWETYTELNRLNEELKAITSDVVLISGRRVPVGRYPNGGFAVHANLNRLVQGSAREFLAGSWRRFGERSPEHARMAWMAVHDEMILNVPQDRTAEIGEQIRSDMTFDFQGVPIDAEADELWDEHGVSRWMPGDHARSIAEAKAA